MRHIETMKGSGTVTSSATFDARSYGELYGVVLRFPRESPIASSSLAYAGMLGRQEAGLPAEGLAADNNE